ncbi:MAG: ubiquinol-cytochrome c reductase iron-sulfur subunit [Solirubrobacterales bacterium]|nr:ubiquinol-cytochrome c reductase iron-sulfur subunit [Solirubrobacterales bacterium]
MPDRRTPPKGKYTADRNIPGAFEGESVTRRRAMVLSAHGAGAVATMAFLLPALGFAAGSSVFERPQVRWQSIGKPEDFPDDVYVPKVITTVAGIGEVGKTTVFVRRYNPDIDSVKYQEFVVLTSRCMHLGCPVRYTEAAQRFICPCHGGVYDFEGKVDGGPPVRPLDRFYNRIRNGEVEVGPRYSVNGDLDRFPSYRDPAQDLDGIGQYLYPGRFSTPKQ